MANITIKESIIDYARDRYYFHINDLKRYFTEKRIKFEEDTLKKYLYLLKKNEVLYPAGRGWYSNIQKEFELNIESTKRIIKLLIENNYNAYLNPYKIEVEKFVELKLHTIILRPSVSSRVSKEKNQAKIEKILVDLFMEMKKITLIDKDEYIKIVSNIVLNYRINIAEILDYAHNRKIKSEIQNIIIKINKSTNATLY